MKKTKTIFLCFFVSCLLAVSSCSMQDSEKLKYNPAPPISLNGVTKPGTLFLANITDNRSKDEKVKFVPETNPLLFIPFWFYSHTYIDPVIRYIYFQPTLTDVLDKLFLTDLNAADIFKQVLNSPKGIEQAKFEEKLFSIRPDTYKLEIILKRAVWSRNVTAYGLSYPGTFLWALGLPISYGNVDFSIEAILYAPEKKLLCKKVINKNVTCTEWIYDQIYYRPPVSEIKLAEIFPMITAELREFIYQSVKTYQIDKKYGSLKNNPAMEEAENPQL
jgi:hypothetical protein